VAQILAFLTLVAGFVFAMGLITHPAGTAQVTNSLANGITNLFTLELGVVPKGK
jgi:fumarate reductase subunit D